MNEKVLFVDDEKNILNAISRALADKDFKVLTAASADEAMGLIARQEVAVVVADNRMPGTRGIELLERVKKLSPDTVKVIMTGYADMATAIEAINVGEVFRFIVKPWQDEDLERVVADALTRYRLVKSLRKADDAVIRSLAQTVELKDLYTRGHCDRVAGYALLIADRLGLSDEEKREIKQGGWLHDCGKIGVPEAVLNFAGRLQEKDFATIREHPVWGAQVAREAQLSQRVVNIILHHHEWYNGQGYPEGLEGKEIPLEARVVAVADVFDTLTSDRPYQKAFDRNTAFSIMSEISGKQLDPELVEILRELLMSTSDEETGGRTGEI